LVQLLPSIYSEMKNSGQCLSGYIVTNGDNQ